MLDVRPWPLQCLGKMDRTLKSPAVMLKIDPSQCLPEDFYNWARLLDGEERLRSRWSLVSLSGHRWASATHSVSFVLSFLWLKWK